MVSRTQRLRSTDDDAVSLDEDEDEEEEGGLSLAMLSSLSTLRFYSLPIMWKHSKALQLFALQSTLLTRIKYSFAPFHLYLISDKVKIMKYDIFGFFEKV